MVEANPAASARPTRVARRSVQHRLWLLALSVWCVAPLAASAQAPSAQAAVGTASSGMHGLIHSELPVAPRELNLAANAGYGVTEAFPPVPGAHHRLQGSLGAALGPLPWLTLALRLDGRYEMHPDDYDGAHSAGFGDLRLLARAGHQLDPSWSLGFEAVTWFPGNQAPSVVPSATSLDLRGLAAFTPQHSPWVVLGMVGFRLDNSANAAPDLTRLRQGDRISLGLSSSNAVLLALGVANHVATDVELFGEVSADLLVGSNAPPPSESPLRAALGGRYALGRAWQTELTATVSLSKRPPIGPNDPLVPIEPRFLMVFGVRYAFALDRAQPVEQAKQPPPAAAKPRFEAPEVRSAALSGVLVDDKGEPLPEATLKLQAAGREQREVITDAQGRYAFADVPLGPATLEAAAKGFATRSWQLDVRAGMAPQGPQALALQSGKGYLRGLIRTFRSEPLRAQIIVRDSHGRNAASRESADDGVFELELPPGSYRVTISAAGYDTHSRSVQIEGNAVSILNVDMHELK
jgi:hypothetical protein